jgi:hypothetical protein
MPVNWPNGCPRGLPIIVPNAYQPKEVPPPPPIFIRLLMQRRVPGDKGLGDTVHRLAEKHGQKWLESLCGKLGMGCERRREAMNLKYPYSE